MPGFSETETESHFSPSQREMGHPSFWIHSECLAEAYS